MTGGGSGRGTTSRVAVAGAPFTGSIGFSGGTAFLVLSAEFRKRAGISVGDEVAVRISPQAGRSSE